MNKDYLKNITKEERALMLEKAKAKREEKKKAGESLRQNYADENYHRSLAKEHGVRLPARYLPSSSTKYLKRVMKKLGVSPEVWLSVEGYKSLSDFSKDNPMVSAVEHIGIFLEWYTESLEV